MSLRGQNTQTRNVTGNRFVEISEFSGCISKEIKEL